MKLRNNIKSLLQSSRLRRGSLVAVSVLLSVVAAHAQTTGTGATTNFTSTVTAAQADAGAVVAGTGLLLIGIMLTFRFFKWVMGSIGGAVKR